MCHNCRSCLSTTNSLGFRHRNVLQLNLMVKSKVLMRFVHYNANKDKKEILCEQVHLSTPRQTIAQTEIEKRIKKVFHFLLRPTRIIQTQKYQLSVKLLAFKDKRSCDLCGLPPAEKISVAPFQPLPLFNTAQVIWLWRANQICISIFMISLSEILK